MTQHVYVYVYRNRSITALSEKHTMFTSAAETMLWGQEQQQQKNEEEI